MNGDLIKLKVQKRIVTFSVLLLIGKFLAFFITNSVGILTDAMESIVNVAAGFISLYSLHIARKPKDKGHPFGHGKIELISASLEGLLIMLAGGLIIFEGVKRLFEPAVISKLDIGIYIVAGAGIINYLLGWYSIHIGKKYHSIALIAGGKHLQSDTYSTIGLVIGLILLYYTQIAWIDSALALIFGSIIVGTGISILRKTTENLMDKADPEILKSIHETIVQNREKAWVDVHNMKVLKYGSNYFMDCDLTLPWYYTVQEGHDCCVDFANLIKSKYPDRIRLSIHTDPCIPIKDCSFCPMRNCQHRMAEYNKENQLTLDKMTQDDDSLV
ncbi:MAG: cation diffusion facilitator family transporter [Bacteroidales bacterium]